MIEKAPGINFTRKVISICNVPEYRKAIEGINREYFYWDKVKYMVPAGIQPEAFWNAVKLSRLLQYNTITFPCCTVNFITTPEIQKMLHNFDMVFGEVLSSNGTVPDKNRQYYLLSSMMEEAIASSRMEGASTTRRIAKEMLRKQKKPADLSQQMILNNYNTIRILSERKNEPLSAELLLEVHKLITERTLDRPEYEGQFRTDDTVVVQNVITGEVVHTPPSPALIKPTIDSLCSFINTEDKFIHPIVKGIILHFMISYLHPFVDGNGRTARSLFYWYLLKKGYWLTEFLSVSRVIYKSKAQYERAFLYTENDEMDLSYFINYNLKAMTTAYEDLLSYLNRKAEEEKALLEERIPNINSRQTRIIKLFSEKETGLLTCKDLERTLNVTVKTIRSDLEELVGLGLLKRVPVNARLVGYAKAAEFESKLGEIRGK